MQQYEVKNMVYKDPQIKTFVSFVSKLFSRVAVSQSGMIYLIKYNSKPTKAIPKEVFEYYKMEVNIHVDGSIIYLPKKNNFKSKLIRVENKNLIPQVKNLIKNSYLLSKPNFEEPYFRD